MLQDKTTISPDRVAGDVPEVHLLQLWRSLLSTGRRSDGFACLCCVGQPVHGVLGRACTQHCPTTWKRYRDDTCCVVKKGTAEAYLYYLNGVRPSIKFTMEAKEDRTLPFLDRHLHRGVTAAWRSRSTESPPTQNHTWTSDSSIPPSHASPYLCITIIVQSQRIGSNQTRQVFVHMWYVCNVTSLTAIRTWHLETQHL